MNTSITACCLVLALFAKGQAMDDASDPQEITLCKIGHSESYLGSLKPQEDNSNLHAILLLNQDEGENSTASFGSYVTSPIKAVIYGAYNVADFAVKHPTQTIVTSLLIAAQFTAATNTFKLSLLGWEIVSFEAPCITIGELGNWFTLGRLCNS
jgi:hypothetical protein